MPVLDPSSERDDSIESEATDFPPIPADLFPLPLSAFEHFMVTDDSPSQPMIEFAQAYFHSPIDLVKLEHALRQALRRNPLLSSRLMPRKKSWDWVYDPSWKPAIRSFTEDPPIVGGRIVPMNLLEEPGLRVWYESKHNEERLYFQIHHACADGIGMRRYITDVLFIYARACALDGDANKSKLWLDRVDHQRLRERGSLKQLERNPPSRRISAWDRMKNLHYFFFQSPQPLKRVATSAEGESADAAELIKVLRMGVQESSSILERANSEDINLNDLGLALLFYTCRRWQQMQNPHAANKRIRLLAPVDLRVKEDLRLSAANRVSFSFIGRTHEQCVPWPALLSSVQTETITIKESHLYADFLRGLQAGLAHPAIMRWVVRRSRNMATAVFTYLGDLNRRVSHNFSQEAGLTRVGDTLLEDVLGSSCVRTNTNIAVTLCVVNGKICMAASWNRQELSAYDTAEFLSLFADAWRHWGSKGNPQT